MMQLNEKKDDAIDEIARSKVHKKNIAWLKTRIQEIETKVQALARVKQMLYVFAYVFKYVRACARWLGSLLAYWAALGNLSYRHDALMMSLVMTSYVMMTSPCLMIQC
jgi:plasmid stabilization system protein ParE